MIFLLIIFVIYIYDYVKYKNYLLLFFLFLPIIWTLIGNVRRFVYNGEFYLDNLYNSYFGAASSIIGRISYLYEVSIIYHTRLHGNISEFNYIQHIKNPIIFLMKQLIILIPSFLMLYVIIKKFKFSINKKNKKTAFLLSINFIPIALILATSIITGAKIRTMWMTPFYLFLGTLFIFIFKNTIDLKKIKKFYYIFLFFFILSPSVYLITSLADKKKRTDYPGKEIARLVQNKWDYNFINEIKIVIGDEWSAGNLSYHLYSRPIWIKDLRNKTSNITEDQGVIYVGNPQILKKICPGIFGTIKPVGYCMIGKR